MESKFDDLAKTIDQASDEKNIDAINRALEKIEKNNVEELSSKELARLYFLKANCYATKRVISGDVKNWSWEDENLEKEIYYLRLSISECNSIPIKDDYSDLRYRVQTNLANALNHVGRFVEAIETWDNVLNENPTYAMAIGNRGHSLSWYARYLYDPYHQPIFLNESYWEIKKALEIGVEKHAVKDLLDWVDHLDSLTDWNEFNFEPGDESRGRSKIERSYRTWCIDNRLFLNPLNDIWMKDIVANDVLTFPPTIVKKGDENPLFPEVYGIYNQLKQEYVSARYILFEAIEESNTSLHFSDKRVKLYDMLDYREYRLWIEKLKMAFLSAYAIFDKIAYLLNQHWNLSINVQSVKFNSVWMKPGDKRKPLLEKFRYSDNWPLRGLFWLSKDLYFRTSENRPIEPDARHLNHIRNHIAHKYLRVYDHRLVDTKTWRENSGHELSYPISDLELKRQTMKVIKLVRSALIYLSLAAHAEESKARKILDDGLLAEMELYEIEELYRL